MKYMTLLLLSGATFGLIAVTMPMASGSYALSDRAMSLEAVGKTVNCDRYILHNSCSDIDSATVPCSSRSKDDCNGQNCIGCSNIDQMSNTCYTLQTFGFDRHLCTEAVPIGGAGLCGFLWMTPTCRWIPAAGGLPAYCGCRGTKSETPCDYRHADGSNSCIRQDPK